MLSPNWSHQRTHTSHRVPAASWKCIITRETPLAHVLIVTFIRFKFISTSAKLTNRFLQFTAVTCHLYVIVIKVEFSK